MRAALGIAGFIVLALGGCAEPNYFRPGATQADLARDDMSCKLEALTTPPPYQSGLPEYGYGYPYGRRASAGDGAGLLLVVMMDRASRNAWQREVYRRCVIAMGYEEMR